MTVRQVTATLLAVVAGLLAVAGAHCWSLSRGVIAQQPFADRAVDALHRDAVRDAVSTEIASQVDARIPDSAASPARVRATVDRVVVTPAFERVFRQGALTLNRSLFHDAASSATLQVNLGRVLESTSPQLARVVGDRSATVLSLRGGLLLRRTNQAADVIRTLGVLLPFLAAAALVGALLIAPRRRWALGAAGLAVAAGGALSLLTLSAAHARLDDAIDLSSAVRVADARNAAEAIWDVFSSRPHTIALVAIAVRLVLALVGLWPRRRARSATSALPADGSRQSGRRVSR